MAWFAERRRRSRFEAVVLPHLDAAYALARWLTRKTPMPTMLCKTPCCGRTGISTVTETATRSWLLKIVSRTTYSWLERNRPAARISLGDAMECEKIDGVSPEATSNLETLMSNRSELRRLDELIGALPAPLREAIGTVMSRLHRARAALRQARNG
jgi:RNA polymerase sigma-70 factor (ECF subfamily)